MVGTVEIWKAEILTVFFTACGIPLALHRIDDSAFLWKVFFFFTAHCMSLEFALNLTIRLGAVFLTTCGMSLALARNLFFLNDALTLHTFLCHRCAGLC